MKKLILIFLLLIAVTGFAQRNTSQFVRNYSQYIVKNSAGEKVEDWKPISVRVFFNYSNQSHKIKMYIGGTVKTFSQIGDTEYGKTEQEITFQLGNLLDDETGEELVIVFYTDEKFGCKFVYEDNSSIQFAP